jgi:hypothetical protein
MVSDRLVSATSVAASAAVLIVAPLHAVAYIRDEGEDEAGAIKWTGPAFDAAPGLWDWASTHAVYLNYGRITSALLPLMLLGALALHRRQRRPARRFERWTARAFGVAATVLVIGAALEYYTPFLEEAFAFVAIPGLLLTLIVGLLFGIATARADAVPTWQGVLLAVAFLPGMPVLVALLGHIPIGMSLVAISWILIGAQLLRART